jgi:hypothetical protein
VLRAVGHNSRCDHLMWYFLPTAPPTASTCSTFREANRWP